MSQQIIDELGDVSDGDLAVAGDHVSRTVGVVLEHSADGRDVGLADTLINTIPNNVNGNSNNIRFLHIIRLKWI